MVCYAFVIPAIGGKMLTNSYGDEDFSSQIVMLFDIMNFTPSPLHIDQAIQICQFIFLWVIWTPDFAKNL